MKKLVLKNAKEQVIRVFHQFKGAGDKIYVVYLSNKGRIDFCSSLDFFEKDSVLLIDEVSLDKKKKYKVPYMSATLEWCDFDIPESDLPVAVPLPKFNNKRLVQAFAIVSACYMTLAVALFAGSQLSSLPEETQAPERLVTVIKSPPPAIIPPKKMLLTAKSPVLSPSQELSPSSKPLKKSLKKMGALSVLGTLSKGRNKGGINLSSGKVSAGPGFRSPAGASSGGVQSQLYSQGMISAALGTGGNIRGGGGHGIKGTQAGGGADGYGKLDLVGSAGTQDLSSSSRLNSEPGAFDFGIIDREIIKNREKIRQCYLKALQKESDLKGLFEFVFQVNTNGRVVFSRMLPSSPVQSLEVSSCIFKVIKSVRFPIRAQENTQINYAFDLSDLEGGS